MIVDSKACEFGYEILGTVPIAYEAYLNNTLEKTISCKNTFPLYFFSPEHSEKYNGRVPGGNNYLPNLRNFDNRNIKMPNYKNFYSGTSGLPHKNRVIITNKIIKDCRHEYRCVSSYSTEAIIKMADILHSAGYEVIYDCPSKKDVTWDGAEELKNIIDEDSIKNSGVLLATDIKNQIEVENYLEFQLKLYSDCNKFISVGGGVGILASLFGGVNILLEADADMVASVGRISSMKSLSGCNIIHSNTYEEVINNIIGLF